MIKLSIIIPCYNKEPYIHELLDCLNEQITKEVQVIVIDDGSIKPLKTQYKWVELYRFDNQGVSKTRNIGLEKAKGKYISFIDADDLVSPLFVQRVMEKIEEGFDVLDMSWKSLPGGIQYSQKLNTERDRLNNPSVCTRVFSKKFIGDLKFNENKRAAEDEEFTRKLGLSSAKFSVITDYMYFYRTSVPNSLSKNYFNGSLEMNRIVYYIPYVTKDMTYLIDEFKKEYEKSEIILMTNDNQIKELSLYAQIMRPAPVRGTELRGEKTEYFKMIEKPIKTQVVLYKEKINLFGGIETFMYNFCLHMRSYYDILVLCKDIEPSQYMRFSKLVRTVCVSSRAITCDTLIVNSILEKPPENIKYKKKVQMCHTCKRHGWVVPDADEKVFVSEAARISFNEKGTVINNLVKTKWVNKALILFTASNLTDSTKGEDRMIKLAKMFKEKNIPFLWFVFTDKEKSPMDGMYYINGCNDVLPYMVHADYVVQLSDAESFCYTIVEALTLGIPVLSTPLDVLYELGFEDGEHGYILPFDLSDVDVEVIAESDLKGFTFDYDNNLRINQWRRLLGATMPLSDYIYKEVEVKVIQDYKDVQLKKDMKKGMILNMEKQRAEFLRKEGLIEYDEQRNNDV